MRPYLERGNWNLRFVLCSILLISALLSLEDFVIGLTTLVSSTNIYHMHAQALYCCGGGNWRWGTALWAKINKNGPFLKTKTLNFWRGEVDMWTRRNEMSFIVEIWAQHSGNLGAGESFRKANFSWAVKILTNWSSLLLAWYILWSCDMNRSHSISNAYFKTASDLDFCGNVFYRLNWF